MARPAINGHWAKVEAKLPGYLEALLASEVFGRGPDRKPPRADELLAQRGQVPLPKGPSPHKLRHTFASMLIACGEDRPR